MSYYVYILQSQKDKKYYTGLTKDTNRRISEHNGAQVKSTKSRIPFKLVYSEKADTLLEARAREKFLKSGAGREFREKNLENK